MTNEQVLKLHRGDEVTWNDPVKMDFPEDDCGRTGRILEIEVRADPSDEDFEPGGDDAVVWIRWEDGAETEMYAGELS